MHHFFPLCSHSFAQDPNSATYTASSTTERIAHKSLQNAIYSPISHVVSVLWVNPTALTQSSTVRIDGESL